jgi:hypothetical protein
MHIAHHARQTNKMTVTFRTEVSGLIHICVSECDLYSARVLANLKKA